MALKDWKKIGKNTYKKGKKEIYLEKSIYYWQVFLSPNGYKYNSYHLTYEHFDNKSQAIKFAKSYMRSH